GVRESPEEPLLQTLMEMLKNRHLLLLLDNGEHLLEAVARLCDAILRACPKVRLMVSSRETLGIAGESAYRIPSLSLPPEGAAARELTPEGLPQYEAARLFIERVEAIKADFAVTPQNLPALVSLCRRLDGIPLAIELAAARIRSLTVEDLE